MYFSKKENKYFLKKKKKETTVTFPDPNSICLTKNLKKRCN